MVGEDKMVMSTKELRRVHLVHQVMEGKLSQGKASEWIGLTDRQMRRLLKRVRKEGDRGLIHRARGRPSNRRFAETIKARALGLYARRYADFGPTLAAEKLAEREGITLSDETLRLWLLERGIDHFRRRKRPHRQWRERRAHPGELVQLDGSHHDWFEGRGPRCVLLAYIDDATNRVFARFYNYEGTRPAMDSFVRYIRRRGIPAAVYCDKHTTYRSPAEPTVEEQLAGEEAQSQFERALRELGVDLIHAHSPQAKGRVERLFKTLQDRLVKEMRLSGIATMEDANRFLERYLPIYNRRFAVPSRETADVHRPVPSGLRLHAILCLKTRRVLRRDFTVAHNGALYQIDDHPRTPHLVVEERLNGSMRITHQGRTLSYHAIVSRPVKDPPAPTARVSRRITKPALDHPWHRRLLQPSIKNRGAAVT